MRDSVWGFPTADSVALQGSVDNQFVMPPELSWSAIQTSATGISARSPSEPRTPCGLRR